MIVALSRNYGKVCKAVIMLVIIFHSMESSSKHFKIYVLFRSGHPMNNRNINRLRMLFLRLHRLPNTLKGILGILIINTPNQNPWADLEREREQEQERPLPPSSQFFPLKKTQFLRFWASLTPSPAPLIEKHTSLDRTHAGIAIANLPTGHHRART